MEAARQIVKSVEHTKVLVLTVHDADPLIQQVLEAGARGYMLKSDAGRDSVVAVVRIRRRNKTFFTPKVAQMVLEGYLDKNPKEAALPEGGRFRLTNRQKEIVQLLAEGKSSKEVASALGLSVKTAQSNIAPTSCAGSTATRLRRWCATPFVITLSKPSQGPPSGDPANPSDLHASKRSKHHWSLPFWPRRAAPPESQARMHWFCKVCCTLSRPDLTRTPAKCYSLLPMDDPRGGF